MSSSGPASVIFTPYDSLGILQPGDAIELEGTYVYGGNKHSTERYNQVAKRTLDGGLNVEDSGLEITTSQVKVEGVLDADGEAFRTWVRDIIKYRLFRFKAEPQDPLLDIGSGRGVTVDNANCTVTKTEEMFTPTPPSNFTIVFPFDFKVV